MVKKAINKISLQILRDAQLKLDELMDMLRPCLVALSPEERQTLIKTGAKFFRFIEISYGIALENPDFFPSFMKAVIVKEDFSIAQELWTFAAKLKQLKDNIHDTEMAAGNYALQTALAFYQTVKIAARHDIPAAGVIFEELKPRRPSGRRRQYRG